MSGRQPGLDEIVDVDRVVSAMQRLLGRVIGEDVELKTTLGGEIWPVLMPAGALEQIITNLVVNSRDAMRQGGRVTIETANLDESSAAPAAAGVRPPGRYVRVTVRDTGCGMTPEVVARATEPFFTTKSEGEGTGLGLSTVYGLVRGAGGDLTIESHPGHGTTCHVLLPAAGEASEAQAVEPATVQRGHGETVLITEDDPIVRRLAVRVLRRAGYRIIEAASPGAAVLEFEARGDSVDLLLTDVVMPVMSGKELADRLRATRPDLRVLFMSGYTDGKLFDDGTEVLPDLLDKPFAPAELLAAVRVALTAT
jgi:CheY-like chemotaxis protein